MAQKITGSPTMVGFICALETLPYLVLSAYGGVVADRIDRRKIMLRSDQSSALLLLGFAGAVYATNGSPPVWLLMLTAASLSVSRIFFTPARSAAIPALVPEGSLLRANSISAATQNFMPLIALSLSAGVLAILYKISPAWFFLSAVLLNMLSFAGSALFVAKLPAIVPDREAVHDVHPVQDMKDGISYVRGRHELWVMLGLQLLLNLMISPFFVVYLAANKAWFHDQPQNLAWLEFSFFLGLVLSSALVGRLKITKPGLGYIFSTIGVGVGVAMMAFTQDFWLFVCWNILAGLSIPFGSIPVSTYLQITVPDAFRGRVNSAWTMASVGVQPVGLSLGGLLVTYAGLVGGFLTMGVGMIVAGCLGLLDRKFRGMTMPAESKAEAPVEEDMAVAAC